MVLLCCKIKWLKSFNFDDKLAKFALKYTTLYNFYLTDWTMHNVIYLSLLKHVLQPTVISYRNLIVKVVLVYCIGNE